MVRNTPLSRASLLLGAAPLLLMAPGAGAAERDPAAKGRDVSSGRTAAARQQVTSLSQFSDLRPTDWAYQALRTLVERDGCIAGYPSGVFLGGAAIGRYEAAALLHACLERIRETTDELRRLTAEFAPELAVLRGRVDGLEARVGELEATLFSPTTRLSGQATFVLGANRFGGSARRQVQASALAYGSTTFSYDLQLTLDTSFSGKDLLRANLRGGNFADSTFGGAGPTPLSQLEVAFQQGCGTDADCGDVVAIDRLFYQVPLGEFTFSVGGRIGQDDMLALWPSVYPTDTVLDVLTLGGAPAAYNKTLGAGAGVWWQRGGLSVSANYVAANGDAADSTSGGISTAGSGGTGTVQLGYVAPRWGLAAIYSSIQNANDLIVYATAFALNSFSQPGTTAAFGLSGYWQPVRSGWIPSISAGWGRNGTTYAAGVPSDGLLRTSQSWSVGLQWTDAFVAGNALGLAVGQPTFATALVGGGRPDDGNLALEAWYQLQLSDQISVTPALFYLSRPLGQDTAAGRSFGQLGGLLKTSFRF